MKVTKLSIKKFRHMLKKRNPSSFQVFHVVAKEYTGDLKLRKYINPRLRYSLEKHKSVFRSGLNSGLPPKR